MYDQLAELVTRSPSTRLEYLLNAHDPWADLAELRVEKYVPDEPEFEGTYYNLLIRIQRGDADLPRLVICAHYDYVISGEGALDNGAAVVSMLGAIDKLTKEDYPIDVTFIFFDGEELGSVGSSLHLFAEERDYDAIFNIDVTGKGDAICIGETTLFSNQDIPSDDELNHHASRVATELGIPHYLVQHIHGSDHLPFLFEGYAATIISVVPKQEAIEWNSRGGGFTPTTFEYINGPDDTLDLIEPESLVMMRDYIVALVEGYFEAPKAL